jgi:membrane-bound lytic murein transglycosylase B
VGRRSWKAVLCGALVALAACGDGASGDQPQEAGTRTTDGRDASTTTAAAATTTVTAPTTTTTAPAFDVSGLPERAPAPPPGPRATAAQLLAAERAIRDPSTPPDTLASMAVVQQVAYRALGRHPDWDATVLANLPTELHRDVQRNVLARREFRAMHTKLSDTLPKWRIVHPPPADDLLRYYREAEQTFGIPWQYLAAINLVETGMGRIRGTSIAGAQGPMQFMPATWEAFGEGDIHDPRDAVLAAGRYLAHNNGGRDIAGALWNYNHSQRYVRGVVAYADVMRDDPRTFFGYYHWGVFYLSTTGDTWLPVGWQG